MFNVSKFVRTFDVRPLTGSGVNQQTKKNNKNKNEAVLFCWFRPLTGSGVKEIGRTGLLDECTDECWY